MDEPKAADAAAQHAGWARESVRSMEDDIAPFDADADEGGEGAGAAPGKLTKGKSSASLAG